MLQEYYPDQVTVHPTRTQSMQLRCVFTWKICLVSTSLLLAVCGLSWGLGFTYRQFYGNSLLTVGFACGDVILWIEEWKPEDIAAATAAKSTAIRFQTGWNRLEFWRILKDIRDVRNLRMLVADMLRDAPVYPKMARYSRADLRIVGSVQGPQSRTVFVVPLWIPGSVMGILSMRGYLRGRRQQMATLCRTCAYQLIGNVSGICPECGTPLMDMQQDLLARYRKDNAELGVDVTTEEEQVPALSCGDITPCEDQPADEGYKPARICKRRVNRVTTHY